MRQGRVTLCNCQMPACHTMTSNPRPTATFGITASQLVEAPNRDGETRASAWVFTRHSACARLTSTSRGGAGGDKTAVATMGDTGAAGSETGGGATAGANTGGA